MEKVLEFLRLAYLVCRIFGGSISSWIRSEEHNRKVGGVPNSQHLKGLAVDIVFDTTEGKTQAMKGLRELGYFVLDEGDHVHVSVPKWKDESTPKEEPPNATPTLP